MSYYRDGLNIATCVMEAAAWHKGVKIICSCGHSAVYDPHGLWALCEKRRWNDSFRALAKHFYCSRCKAITRRKVRPARIEPCEDKANIILPMPSGHDWKRALRRFRT